MLRKLVHGGHRGEGSAQGVGFQGWGLNSSAYPVVLGHRTDPFKLVCHTLQVGIGCHDSHVADGTATGLRGPSDVRLTAGGLSHALRCPRLPLPLGETETRDLGVC